MSKILDMVWFIGSKINKLESCPYKTMLRDDAVKMLKEIESKYVKLLKELPAEPAEPAKDGIQLDGSIYNKGKRIDHNRG